jgi:predicted lipoprotein with Yx(FWY)xxD motif
MKATNVHAKWARLPLLVTTAAGLFGLAACSSGASKGTATPAGQAGRTTSASHTTIQLATAGGRSVLADSKGDTLYVNDQDRAGTSACSTNDCTAIWIPLTVPTGQKPTGPAPVSTKLAAIARPDGTMQVTLDGKPLYAFSFDHGSGKDTGNGAKDSFGGTNFTWHVATTTRAVPASTAPSSASSSSGNGVTY